MKLGALQSKWKPSTICYLLLAVFFLGLPLLTHAQGLGNFGLQYVTEIGLPTQDVRVVIARIIRTALGLLGLVAVVIILYGGFVWMIAGGEESKISQAKQIITNGVIGLAIIVSAFAIASFVIRSLISASLEGGPGGPGGPGGGSGGGLPAGAYTVRSISPSGTLTIRNVTVRAVLSSAVNAATVPGNFSVTRAGDGAVVSSATNVSGGEIRFEPASPCPAPNEDRLCFEANTEFVVRLTNGIRSTDNRALTCGGFAPSCESRFTTGNAVDVASPTVSITSPEPGQSVSVNALISVYAAATDDAGVSKIDFFADGNPTSPEPGNTAAPASGNPTTYNGDVLWDTVSASFGAHTLTARAYDVDSNNTTSVGVGVMVRAEHCFDSVRNFDEVGLDCGGVDCGACGGGTCTSASQCASGVCEGGACIDVPRIDFVSPADGAPGNYVTIGGAFFGSVPGTITFLGDAVTPADDRLAALAPCNGAWQNNQIVVAVPDGAVSGPIRVSVGELGDGTNDERGPFIDGFEVNTTLRPGLCEVAPAFGMVGEEVMFSGTQFGDTPGTAAIGGRSINPTWGAAQIVGTVPLIASGSHAAQVVVGNEVSNPVNFTVLSEEAATLPRIDFIDPSSGPPTQYISIFGANFGSTPGTVRFRLPDGTSALALTNFPAACSANYWHDSAITVKVPLTYADGSSMLRAPHTVVVTRADGKEATAAAPFGVNSNPTVPGVCAVAPTGGPVGTPVTISGERFGATGLVRFYQNKDAAPSVWSDQSVQANVPDGAATGPVKVVIGDNAESNGVNFQVGACTPEPNSCNDGDECCPDGTCRDGGGCAQAAVSGGYVWRFSTGAIPEIPRVAEEQNCVNISQSPSPWRNVSDACVNASIAATFTVPMDTATFSAGTIVIQNCGANDTFNADDCDTENPLPGTFIVADLRFVFTPSANLEPNTWYRVTMRSDASAPAASIRGADGRFLDGDNDGEEGGDYIYKFRTRASAEPCDLDHVEVVPANATLSARNTTLPYRADPTAGNCNVLDCTPYNWVWTPSGTVAAATLESAVTCNATARAVAETPPGVPFVVTASASSATVTKSDSGTLTIDFANPRVIRAWPACSIACVNATIGLEFNTEMDEGSILRNLDVYPCANESCRTIGGVLPLSNIVTVPATPGPGGGITELRVTAPLVADAYYRAVLRGSHRTGAGVDGAQSMSGAYLTELNYGDGYSWTFRTRTDPVPCAIERVTLSPSTATLSYVGAVQSYVATAHGGADDCDPSGQQLLATSYDWSWELTAVDPPAPAVIAVFAPPGAPLNVLPLTGTVGCSSTCLKLGSTAGVSVCGNGTVERGEDCDGGAGCSTSCLHVGSAESDCVNAVLDDGEDCIGGNTTAGDGCSAACLNEGALPGISICGNGDIGDGEDCDDGNSSSGDGCSAECLNEGTSPAPAGGVCGDGVVGAAESCDDGNSSSGDGCSSVCLNEGVGPSAWSRAGASGNCGNGVLQRITVTGIGEECDDGNTDSGDGCSNRCLLEGSSLLYAIPSLCGDGVMETSSEACEFTGAGDGRVDPVQYARAVFGGTATVQGESGSVSDEATLTVLCNCTSDTSCARSEIPAGYGCGTDKCCSGQPTVEAVIPPWSATGLCRNTAIWARFSTKMSRASLVGNVILAEAAAACPPGRSIAGAPGYCASNIQTTIVAEDAGGKTTVSVNPVAALPPNTYYWVVIRGGADGVKSARGVAMAERYAWPFGVGADICRLHHVTVDPDEWGFTTANNINDDDSVLAGFDEASDRDKVFTARAFSVRAGTTEEEIVSTPTTYPFGWSWATSDATVVATSLLPVAPGAVPPSNQIEARAQPKNGAVSLTARAEVTAGVDDGLVVSADAALTVLLCENPWPTRRVSGEWNPWRDIGGTPTNFEIFYCRDRDGEDLPALVGSTGGEEPTVVPTPPPGVLKEFLLRNPVTNDAIGIRVVGNANHVAPLSWYRSQGFAGSPSAFQVDGYQALRDGRTVYVGGANKIGDPIYTNIYLMSVSDNATEGSRQIFDELVGSWRFNVNVSDELVCSGNEDPCTVDSDCGQQGPCDGRLAKLRRDVKRLADIREIESTLESYSGSRRHCSVSIDRFCATNAHCPSGEICVASYPAVGAGSFLRSFTNSRWPSWQAVLGNDTGAALPTDPLNRFGEPCAAPFDAETCFDAGAQAFRCPVGSHTYTYRSIGGTGYTLGATLEFAPASEWSPAMTPLAGGGASYMFEIPAVCSDTVITADTLCGNGVLGSAETCELNETRVMPCTDSASRAGTRRDACNNSCSGWALGTCETGRCGDGVVQVPENCDDGSLNGTYGHCRSDCTGPGPFCGDVDSLGDGIINGSETCDDGPLNGQYSVAGNCAWNCLGTGPRCGDGAVNGPEPCDGTVQSSTGYCSASLAPCSTNAECPSGQSCSSLCSPSSDGFPQVHTRSCGSSCAAWNPWSGCQPQGGCGNGVREGAEECDDGNTNQNDACIITSPGGSPTLPNNCDTAACGDGFVRLGVEACDNGLLNGNLCTPSYGSVCNYCGTSCTLLTRTGGYCGDNTILNQPEVCDGAAGLPAPPPICAVGSKCPLGSTPTIDYRCYADCSATCPYTYSNLSLSFSRAPALSQFSSTIDVESANLTCSAASPCSSGYECLDGRCTNTYLNIPACRLAATSTPLYADLSFANAAWKPLDVVFLFDVSGTTDDVSYPSCGTSLQCVKQAVAGPGGAIDQLFDNYPGTVRVGVVKFSLPYPRVPRVAGFTPFAVDVNAGTPRYCSGTQELRCTIDADCGGVVGSCLIDPAPLDHLAGETSRAALKTKAMDTITTQGEDDAHLGYEKAQEIFTNYSSADAEKVLIYVSDGAAVNCPTQAKLEADALKLSGVKIYAVAFSTNSTWLRSESSECLPGQSRVAAVYNNSASPPPDSAPRPQTDWCTTITDSSIVPTGCPGAGEPKYYYRATSASDLDPIYADIIKAVLTADVRVGTAPITSDVPEGAEQILNTTVTCTATSQQIPFWTTFGGSGTIGVSNARLRYCP